MQTSRRQAFLRHYNEKIVDGKAVPAPKISTTSFVVLAA